MVAAGVTSRCLEPEQLLALAAEGDDTRSPSDALARADALAHARGCTPCRMAIAAVMRAVRSDLAGTAGGATAVVDDAALPGRIGRYQVLRRVGSGAMGEVFAAFDPRLRRQVAIKRLHPHVQAQGELQPLAREARSLARLADPNVVAVLESGPDWIAMELVDGPTLAEWQRGKPWRAIVEVYLQAASGLAAAHRLGVVHRDFKPHNVLVQEHENGVRARVADFGLASGDVTHEVASDSPTSSRAGTRLRGTPAYMAPELLRGGQADATSDQFSYCVALWEALAGQRPFAGDDVVSLADAVIAGRRRPRPRSSVPGAVWRVVERGLRGDGDARWPDMDRLSTALRRAASSRPLRSMVVGAAFASVAAFAWPAASQPCDDDAPITDVWNAERAAATRADLLRSGASFADTTAENVLARLDRYAESWTHAHADACASGIAVPVALACLDDRKAALDDVAARIAADDRIAAAAVRVVQRLPTIASCQSGSSHHDRPAADTALARRIAGERVTMMAAADEAAVVRAEDLVEQASATNDAVLLAEARGLLGGIHGVRGRWDVAMPLLEQAYLDALRVHDDALVAETAHHLAMGANWLGRPADALRWVTLAEGRAEDEEQRAAMVSTHAEALVALDRRAEALDALTEQLSRTRASYARVTALTQLATLQVEANRLAEAESLLDEAVAYLEREVGTEHHELAPPVNMLGIVQLQRGMFDAAVTTLERARGLASRSGADLPRQALVLGNLAHAYGELGDPERAYRTLLEVGALFERHGGPQDPRMLSTHVNLARWAAAAGRPNEAIRHAHAAIALRGELGIGEADISAYRILVPLRRQLGDLDGAAKDVGRLLALRHARTPTDHDAVGWVELEAADIARLRGDPSAADHIDRALDHYARSTETSPGEQSRAWMVGAAIHADDRPRARADLRRAWTLLTAGEADIRRSIRDSALRLQLLARWREIDRGDLPWSAITGPAAQPDAQSATTHG